MIRQCSDEQLQAGTGSSTQRTRVALHFGVVLHARPHDADLLPQLADGGLLFGSPEGEVVRRIDGALQEQGM